MTEVIDAFTHALPRRFVEEMNAAHEPEELSDVGSLSYLTAVDKRVDVMEELGVDKQVVTLAKPQSWLGIDPEDAIDLARVANDGIREMATDHPDHFIPVATLPFLEGEYLDELDRCLDDLGMAGVQIFSNIEGRPLDEDAFRPFFERVDDRQVPIWIHPQLYSWYPWIDDYRDHKALGWPFDTSLAISRLVSSGIMEEYDLDVVTHHGGGMIPHYGSRLKRFNEPRGDDSKLDSDQFANVTRPVDEYYRSFFADTVVNGSANQLDCVYEYFGPEQVVFATDYPYGAGEGRKRVETTVSLVQEMDVPPDVRSAIFAGNIESILD